MGTAVEAHHAGADPPRHLPRPRGIARLDGALDFVPLFARHHDGEFCRLDRAIIFEDPDGTRILYDAGRTVRGPGDPRLGRIDAVLLSHVHGDCLGDRIQPAANADGKCVSGC